MVTLLRLQQLGPLHLSLGQFTGKQQNMLQRLAVRLALHREASHMSGVSDVLVLAVE